jgi:hypothetical protein
MCLLAFANAGEPLRRFFGADPLFAEVLENLAPLFPRNLAQLPRPQAVVAGGITKGAEEIVEAGNDGAVGNAELSLDILDDASVSDERIEKGDLLSREAGISSKQKMPFNRGATGRALETGNRQFICADRTPAKDVR